MSAAPAMAEGRQHDLVSRVSRGLGQLVRTKTLRPADPTPIVSFTFDDIPDTAAGNGAAVLEREGALGTFYVAGGLCGRSHLDWTFACAEALASLRKQGHEIGCHTFDHPDVQTLTRRSVAEELDRNAAALAMMAPGLRMTNFAYPYGSVALPQKQVVQRRFRSARGTREGLNRGAVDLGQLRAVRLYDHLIDADRLDALVGQAVRERGWLVFYTHDVAAIPTPHGCSPSLLATALAIARRHGCPVMTVDAALDRLER